MVENQTDQDIVKIAKRTVLAGKIIFIIFAILSWGVGGGLATFVPFISHNHLINDPTIINALLFFWITQPILIFISFISTHIFFKYLLLFNILIWLYFVVISWRHL